MDFKECDSGRLRTQDRGCYADIEDPVQVLWLPLRMMMRRYSLKTSGEMWSHAWQDPYLSQTLFRQSQIPNFQSVPPCLRIIDAQVSPAPVGSDNGTVATVAEPAFRRLRLISQGARISQASGSVGVVDESMQGCIRPRE